MGLTISERLREIIYLKRMKIITKIVFVFFMGLEMLLKPVCADNPSLVYLLFQEVVFNIPTDSFFVVKLDLTNGKTYLLDKISYEKAIELYGDSLGDISDDSDLEEKGFIYAKISSNLNLIYLRKEQELDENKRYKYVLANKEKKIVLREFPSNTVFGFKLNKLLFLDRSHEKLKALDYKHRSIKEETPEIIDSFITLKVDGLLLFLSDGSVVKYSKGERFLIKKMKGIVTESGNIQDVWGWYCFRSNEKSKGQLVFLNVITMKEIVNRDVESQCRLIKILSNFIHAK